MYVNINRNSRKQKCGQEYRGSNGGKNVKKKKNKYRKHGTKIRYKEKNENSKLIDNHFN